MELGQIEAHVRTGLDVVLDHVPDGLRVERDGVLLRSTGVGGPGMNVAEPVGPVADAEGTARWAAATLTARDAPSMLVLPEPWWGSPLGQAFEDLRVGERQEAAVMWRAIPDQGPVPRADGLRIEVARTVEVLHAQAMCAAGVFGAPDARLAIPATPATLLADDRIAFLAGRVDDEVVAASSCAVRDGIAAITGVAVQPAWARRGIGTAMTAAAMAEAASRGARTAVLEASGMAERVYARMGFERVGAVLHLDLFPS